MLTEDRNAANALCTSPPDVDSMTTGSLWTIVGDWEVTRVVLHRFDGAWFVTQRCGQWFRYCQESEVPAWPGDKELQWSWNPVARDWGYAVLWRPKRSRPAECSGGPLLPSPLYEDLYSGYDLKIGVEFPKIAGRRAAEERRILDRADSSHACVFKSLYAMASRPGTRQWLLSLNWERVGQDGHRRGLGEEEIWQLCRRWSLYEDTTLDVFQATITRTRFNKNRRGDLRIVRRFVARECCDERALVLIAIRQEVDGPVTGHALPFRGCMQVEFSVAADHCYIVSERELRDGDCFAAEGAQLMQAALRNEAASSTYTLLEDECPAAEDEDIAVTEDVQRACDALDAVMLKAKAKKSPIHPDNMSIGQIDETFKLHSRAKTPPSTPQAALATVQQTDEGMPMNLRYRDTDILGLPVETKPLNRVSGEEYHDFDFVGSIDNVVFDGIQDSGIPGVKWRQGWWDEPPNEEYSCADWIRYEMTFAHVASATEDYVRENGKSVLYLPVRDSPGFVVRDGYVSNLAGRRAKILQAGDFVECRWTRFIAVGEKYVLNGKIFELLRLKRCGSNRMADVVGVPGFRCFWKNANIVHGPRPAVAEKKLLHGIEYKAMAMVTDDPVQNMAIHAVRAQQGKEDFKIKPKDLMADVKEYLSEYKKLNLGDVSGPFRWGYCYSGCGRERPGRFAGRICPECTGTNTDLGQFVADGHRVCSLLNPIKYPGVVWTQRKHFAIKESAKSRVKLQGDCGEEKSPLSVRDFAGRELGYEDVRQLPLNRNRGPRLGGVAIDGAAPFVTAGGVQPLVEAIMFRVFKDLDQPDKQGYTRQHPDPSAFAAASRCLPALLPRLWYDRICPIGVIQWINEMPCRRRRAALMRTLLEWRKNGYVLPKDWDLIKAFVKGEQLASVGTSDEWWYSGEIIPNGAKYVPRLIQAPHDVTHLIAGPFLRQLTRALKREWGPGNFLFYGSTDPSTLDLWLNKNRHAISWFWSDYTAFDATYSDEAWDLIESLYDRVFSDMDTSQLKRVLGVWRRPHGRMVDRGAKITTEYSADVCNCSGRDDTALANALLNGVVLAMSFAAAINGCDVTAVQPWMIDYLQTQCSISIVGDDSIVACYFDVDSYRSAIEANIRRFGLIVKAESSTELCDVTYLGMMPYPVEGGMLQWGPTIGRRLHKAFWQREPEGSLPAWTRGVAQQLGLYRNVPILFELAEQVDSLLLGHKVTRVVKDRNRVWASRESATAQYVGATIDWVCRRYRSVGVTPSMINRDISIIRSIERLPAVVRLEAVERMISMDDL